MSEASRQQGVGNREQELLSPPVAYSLLPILAGATALLYIANLPAPQTRLAGFATPLGERSPAQRHNARLAANSLHGAVIAPGGVLSFNARVKSWSQDAGYVKAPVSFNGQLLPAFGGGVCQTSTTLYNAALLAGLQVQERHHHVFAPQYVAPGRDAAVAYPNIDLRLRNPHPFPVQVRAKANGDTLTVEVWATTKPVQNPPHYTVETRILSETTLPRVTVNEPTPGNALHRRPLLRSLGARGFRVVTYRRTVQNGQPRRERLSDDSYPALPEVVRYRLAQTP